MLHHRAAEAAGSSTPSCCDGDGPRSWGSQSWQTFAIRHGGRRMLSSGARSSQRKRQWTRNILRRMRDGLVGFGWLSRWLRER